MSEGPHISNEDLRGLIRGEGTPDERLGRLRHLEACHQCRHGAAGGLEPRFVIAAVDRTDHLTSSGLEAYARGTLDAADLEIAEEHLEGCEECRDHLPARETSGLNIRWILAAAAAVLVLAIGVARLLPWPAPSTGMPEYPNAAWTALVRYALRNRALPPAADRGDLKETPDPLRGAAPRERTVVLTPAGIVVDDTRPVFRWPRTTGATNTVLLQPRGASTFSRSPELTGSEWQPPSDVQRGVTYEWQVEVRRGGMVTTIPAPSAPPALFRVLDARLHRDLDDARRSHPNDSLLLAVLYARAGMDDRAAAELAKLRSRPQDAGLADDLRRSLSGTR